MTTNLALIPGLTRPGANAIFGMGNPYDENKKLYGAPKKASMNVEEDIECRYYAAAMIKPEGQAMATDTAGQRVTTRYYMKTIALSTSITHEAIRDNLYKTQFPQQMRGLKDAIDEASNILGTNILNNAFNPAFPAGDGQPICSANHPIDGGFYSNTFSGATSSFNEGSVEQAITKVQLFRTQAGILTQTNSRKLVGGPGLQFDMSRLINSQFRIGVPNNDISAIYHADYFSEGYADLKHLVSPTAWFVLTDAQNGFKHFVREAVQLDSDVDFKTKSVLWSAMKSEAYGVSNCRAVFGSPGA